MNTKKLIRHLVAHNCHLARHGANHDIWERKDTDLMTALPRHRETDSGLMRKICRDLDIPVPPEK